MRKLPSLLLSLSLIGCSILDTSFEHEMARPGFKKYKNQVDIGEFQKKEDEAFDKDVFTSIRDETTSPNFTATYKRYKVIKRTYKFIGTKTKDMVENSVAYTCLKLVYDAANNTSLVIDQSYKEIGDGVIFDIDSIDTSFTYQKDNDHVYRVDNKCKYYAEEKKSPYDILFDLFIKNSRTFSTETHIAGGKFYIDDNIFTQCYGVGENHNEEKTRQLEVKDSSYMYTYVREARLENVIDGMTKINNIKDYSIFALEVNEGSVKQINLDNLYKDK